MFLHRIAAFKYVYKKISKFILFYNTWDIDKKIFSNLLKKEMFLINNSKGFNYKITYQL